MRNLSHGLHKVSTTVEVFNPVYASDRDAIFLKLSRYEPMVNQVEDVSAPQFFRQTIL